MTTSATDVSRDGREPRDEGYWEAEASDVQGIEKALASLRKQYASPAAAREGQAGTRNSVANLVIYAGSERDAEQARETVARLAGRQAAETLACTSGAPGARSAISRIVREGCRPARRATVSRACSASRSEPA